MDTRFVLRGITFIWDDDKAQVRTRVSTTALLSSKPPKRSSIPS
jgi:hypothetical protein